MSVPKKVTADTGMDVLTHAIESYVSVMSDDYTDGLAINAIQLVFEYWPLAYEDGSNEKSREKKHNTSTIAGMAFAHGHANTILLPHVIRYNAAKPTKFTAFPKYGHFIADQGYAEIARILGLPAHTVKEGVESLIQAIIDLAKKLNIEMSIVGCGVDKKEFEEKVDRLAEQAFEDQCTTANPRLSLVTELAEIYKKPYKGV